MLRSIWVMILMSACFKSVQRKTFIFRVLSIGVLSFKNKVHIGFAPVIINSSKELQRQLFRIIKLWLMYWQSYTLVFQTSTLNFILQWKNLKFIVMTFQCSFWTTMKSRTRMFCHKKPSGSHLCNDKWFFNLAHSKILLCK